MQFWKEHMPLRSLLMTIFFVVGMALILFGWSITGKMSGLVIMIVGLALLLTALLLYNKIYEDPK